MSVRNPDWYPAYDGEGSHPLWLDTPLYVGSNDVPTGNGIVVIGSGLSGASAAFWLLEAGFKDITVLDWRPGDAATNRNCGHILYGTVESAAALRAIKGEPTANKILSLSVDLCHEVRSTISRLGTDCNYAQDGYLVMAVDDAEEREVRESAEILNSLGIENRLLSSEHLRAMGYIGVKGGRFEVGSARAHPVKFRNALMQAAVNRGVRYHSNVRVTSVEDEQGGVRIVYDRGEGTAPASILSEAAVIAANAYSPLFSGYFRDRRLVEPFRGQIIASAPLTTHPGFSGAQSFDHGYIYAVWTPDNRLVIGGWRNHTDGGEAGSYDTDVNPLVEDGLKTFVKEHFDLGGETPQWTHSWGGIMAASKTGMPFIGPTSSQRIFALAGYTGHGFSWAHGAAKILAGIMSGDGSTDPELLAMFRP